MIVNIASVIATRRFRPKIAPRLPSIIAISIITMPPPKPPGTNPAAVVAPVQNV
jgi:hypothetical protein